MDDFPPSMGGCRPEPQIADDESIDTDRQEIWDVDNPNQIVTFAPKESFRLGFFDVTCLVLNRTIGTGIFNSPQRVMRGTHSTGASLLLWFLGSLYCLSGAHVYIEYGLNIPRFSKDGVEQPVARSGGDLNYLEYVYPFPRKDSILFSTCLFGVAFITLGNMAGNCISFSERILGAANVEDPNQGLVRGIALATALFTCFLHTFSRRGGIVINNFLAIIKVLILLFIIIVAILVAANALPLVKNRFVENTHPSNSFDGASNDANGFAQAFLAIIFSFSGFEQPNYVLGEVRKPRRYPFAMLTGVTTIICLYMAVNLSYMVVVPSGAQMQLENGSVALQFFDLSIGSLRSGNDGNNTTDSRRIFDAMLAISSLGNISVMTYTATRVKAQIAKTGIIPFPKFFGQNTDLSLGRVLYWLQRKGYFPSLFKLKWFSPEYHSEKTPFGALLLHFAFCLILILSTWSLEPNAAYNLLTSLSSYVINGFMGTFLGLGILILRFRGPPAASVLTVSQDGSRKRPSWAKMTGPKFKPIISVLCASIYTVGNLWPVVINWIPSTNDSPPEDDSCSNDDCPSEPYDWWLAPTICWAIIGLGSFWFLGFCGVAWSVDRRRHEVFVVEKKPEFDETDGGGLVLVHETVYLSWVGKETLRARRPGEGGAEMDEAGGPTGAMFKGTDFDGYFQEPLQQPQYRQGGFDGPYRV
ncbi:hypothetical protein S40288_07930 [Stachybotrys chartarum IBT 40288]|nr:hypothetical protein S40288_07930 [Stachybotrys chartarum IBT 40288]